MGGVSLEIQHETRKMSLCDDLKTEGLSKTFKLL
jgi:hypothetical protein